MLQTTGDVGALKFVGDLTAGEVGADLATRSGGEVVPLSKRRANSLTDLVFFGAAGWRVGCTTAASSSESRVTIESASSIVMMWRGGGYEPAARERLSNRDLRRQLTHEYIYVCMAAKHASA